MFASDLQFGEFHAILRGGVVKIIHIFPARFLIRAVAVETMISSLLISIAQHENFSHEKFCRKEITITIRMIRGS